MTDIPSNISKAAIAPLPTELFGGRIIVVHSVADVEKAVSYLKGFPILGIDTETRPSFAKGKTYEVALMQVSTEDTCFLFRLNYIGMPDALLELLQDSQQLKVGLSLRDDIQRLQAKHRFSPRGFLDLQSYVKEMGIEAQSLQKIFLPCSSARRYPSRNVLPIGKLMCSPTVRRVMLLPMLGLVYVYIIIWRS